MEEYKVTHGMHVGESAVVVSRLPGGIVEVMTLAGLRYYDKDGKPVCPRCKGTEEERSIFGKMRCQRCLYGFQETMEGCR